MIVWQSLSQADCWQFSLNFLTVYLLNSSSRFLLLCGLINKWSVCPHNLAPILFLIPLFPKCITFSVLIIFFKSHSVFFLFWSLSFASPSLLLIASSSTLHTDTRLFLSQCEMKTITSHRLVLFRDWANNFHEDIIYCVFFNSVTLFNMFTKLFSFSLAPQYILFQVL